MNLIPRLTTKPVQNFTIYRPTWCFGGAVYERIFGQTYLYNDYGFMCCLGQIGLQCSLSKWAIMGHPKPFYVWPKYKINWMFLFGTSLAEWAMTINDDGYIRLRDRESKLIELFKKENIFLTFVGHYDPRVLDIEARMFIYQ